MNCGIRDNVQLASSANNQEQPRNLASQIEEHNRRRIGFPSDPSDGECCLGTNQRGTYDETQHHEKETPPRDRCTDGWRWSGFGARDARRRRRIGWRQRRRNTAPRSRAKAKAKRAARVLSNNKRLRAARLKKIAFKQSLNGQQPAKARPNATI